MILANQRVISSYLPKVDINRISIEDIAGNAENLTIPSQINLSTDSGIAATVDLSIKFQKSCDSLPPVLDEKLRSLRDYVKVRLFFIEDLDLLRGAIVDNDFSNLSNPIEFSNYGSNDLGNLEDGIEIHPFNITRTFERVSNLSVLAYSCFDSAGFAEANNLPVSDKMTELLGNLSNAIFVEGGQVVSFQMIKTLPEGRTRRGPTNKVLDLRVHSRLNEYPLSLIGEERPSESRPDLRGDINNFEPHHSYFSELYRSRDVLNNCRYFFSMDWHRMIMENSVFGKLFQNNDVDAKMLAGKTKINSLKIYRERIQDKLLKPFDERQSIDTLLVTKDGDNDLKSVDYQEDSFQERVDLASSGLLGLRHFSGVDRQVSHLGTGLYKHTVEVEFSDNTISFVNQRMNDLLKNIGTITEYFEDGERVQNNTYANPSTSPYIEAGSQRLGERGDVNVGNYNSYLRKFTDGFVVKYDSRDASTNMIPRDSLERSISNFIDTYRFIVSANSLPPDSALWDKIEASIKNYLDPMLATPESVNLVIDSMCNVARAMEDAMSLVLRKYAGNQTTMEASQSNDPNGKSHTRAKDRRVVIKKDFGGTFDSRTTRDLGFDFLGTTTRVEKDLGLYELSRQEIKTRADTEIQKYWARSDFSVENSPLQRADSSNGTFYTHEDIGSRWALI